MTTDTDIATDPADAAAAGAGTVIVGYDGSPDAKRALAWANGLAKQLGAPLRVVVATGDMRLRQVTELDQEWERHRLAELVADARAAVAAVPLPRESLELVDAGPAPALIAGADRSSVIVVGSRGHGRVSGALSGSVTGHVARHAPCTVVVVREQSSPEATRVVVGVDASEGAEPALRFAFEHAERSGAPLTALHVLQTWAPGPPYASRFVSDRFTHALAEAEPMIDRALEAHASRHPSVPVERQVVAGTVGRVLSDASEEAALLVVGSRGRGAFASMLLGSVAQSVLHHAHCPVVVAR